MTLIRYQVDARDTIVWVDAGWVDFADRNQAHHLSPPQVVGRRLPDFVAGNEVRRLWSLLLQRVREEERAVALPFRCDSPGLRRFMQMELDPIGAGGVLLHARLIRQEPRSPVPLLDLALPRCGDELPICSQCRRIQDPEGRWVELEEGIARLDLLGAGLLPRLAHVLCEPCLASFQNAIHVQRSANETNGDVP